MNETGNQIQTSNFVLACLLKLNDAELSGIDKSNPRRAVFYFYHTPQLAKLAGDFLLNGSDFKVSIRDFTQVQKQLKSLIYEEWKGDIKRKY